MLTEHTYPQKKEKLLQDSHLDSKIVQSADKTQPKHYTYLLAEVIGLQQLPRRVT